MKKVLGLDIGGTFLRIAVVDETTKVTYENKFSVAEIIKEGPNDLATFIKRYYDLIIDNHDIVAISIGVPGIVKNNCIIDCPNIHELECTDFEKLMKKHINLPVYIVKDTCALLRYDIHNKNISEPNVLGFYIGTGFGNAIYLNNKFFQGDNGFSGEIGHIPYGDENKICGCGKTGCSETSVSGRRLVEISREDLGCDISNVFTKESKALDKFIKDMANIIVTEINILDVYKVIIGGGVISMDGFPKQKLTNFIIDKLRCDSIKNKINIMFSSSDSFSGIIGTSLYAFDMFE